MDPANADRLLFCQALVSREIVSTDLHCWSIGTGNDKVWRVTKKSPPPGKPYSSRHAESHDCTRIPGEGHSILWFTGTAAIIAGSGHFCLPLLEDKILSDKSQTTDLTRITNLGILRDGGRFGAPRQTSFVPTMNRRLHNREELHRHSTGDQRQDTNCYIQHDW